MRICLYKQDNNGVLYSFLSIFLKGISQVILVENALSGFIILIAITTASYLLGAVSLLSSIIGTLVGIIGGADELDVKQGLFGYNSVLTGIALTLFLSGPYRWVIALVGAVIAALITAAMMNISKKIGLPILTVPFVILTWFVLISSNKLGNIKISSSLARHQLSQWQSHLAGVESWIDGSINGIGEIFLLHSTITGILLLVAVFVGGWKYGLYSIAGNIAALIIAFILGGERNSIFLGLYGYNAILTVIAVSITYTRKQKSSSLILGIIAACLTVPITASISAWLFPYGLPALTMPFILSTWLVIGARKTLPSL